MKHGFDPPIELAIGREVGTLVESGDWTSTLVDERDVFTHWIGPVEAYVFELEGPEPDIAGEYSLILRYGIAVRQSLEDGAPWVLTDASFAD